MMVDSVNSNYLLKVLCFVLLVTDFKSSICSCSDDVSHSTAIPADENNQKQIQTSNIRIPEIQINPLQPALFEPGLDALGESVDSLETGSDRDNHTPGAVVKLLGDFSIFDQASRTSSRASNSGRGSGVFSPRKKPSFHRQPSKIGDKNITIIPEDNDHLIPVYNLSKACSILEPGRHKSLYATISTELLEAETFKKMYLTDNSDAQEPEQYEELVADDRPLNNFYHSRPYPQLMSHFRSITADMEDLITTLKKFNFQTSVHLQKNKIPDLVASANRGTRLRNRLAYYAKYIQAWKHVYLFVASAQSGFDIDSLKDGFETGTFAMHELTSGDDDNENVNEKFMFSFQLDCMNYIFRRRLYQLASEYDHYCKLQIYMFSHNLNPENTTASNMSDPHLIEYFASDWYKSMLSQFGGWIRKTFECSNACEPEWMEQAMNNSRYDDITHLNPQNLPDWVMYALKFDINSNIKPSKKEIINKLKKSTFIKTPKSDQSRSVSPMSPQLFDSEEESESSSEVDLEAMWHASGGETDSNAFYARKSRQRRSIDWSLGKHTTSVPVPKSCFPCCVCM